MFGDAMNLTTMHTQLLTLRRHTKQGKELGVFMSISSMQEASYRDRRVNGKTYHCQCQNGTVPRWTTGRQRKHCLAKMTILIFSEMAHCIRGSWYMLQYGWKATVAMSCRGQLAGSQCRASFYEKCIQRSTTNWQRISITSSRSWIAGSTRGGGAATLGFHALTDRDCDTDTLHRVIIFKKSFSAHAAVSSKIVLILTVYRYGSISLVLHCITYNWRIVN